ncbi:MAG: zinc-binding dehydrogenase [Cyclobacteriaceae bacterium]
MIRQSYQVSKAGNINRLKLIEQEVASPGEHQIQIQIAFIGLNFADIFAVLGLYSATPQGSFTPGLECSGRVIAIGDKVTQFEIGDQVMAVTRFGGYTTHLNLDQDYAVKLPNDWTLAEGAGFLVQALTAYYGLFNLGNLKSKDTVLIHSAAGGVGLLANRMVQKVGGYTIGTIGSSAKIPKLKEEGFQDWIVRDKYFARNLKEKLASRELNIVMECIGGKVFKAGYENLSPMGRMVIYGSARYGSNHNYPNWPALVYKYLTRPFVDPQGMIESNKAILGFNLIWLYDRKELMKEAIEGLFQLNLPPPFVGHQFSFNELKNAIKLFQSGATTGKVVVKVI